MPGATFPRGSYGENAVKLSVAAPPVDGKANAEVGRFLAGLLDVPRSGVDVVRGASARDRSIFLRGDDEGKILERLRPLP